MVYFPDAKVVMVSDQITAATPIVDFANGGSAVEWTQILDGVLKLDFEMAIPGRGEPKTRAEVQAYRMAFGSLVSRASDAVKAGATRDQLATQVKTDDLGWQFNAQFYGQLYDEISSWVARLLGCWVARCWVARPQQPSHSATQPPSYPKGEGMRKVAAAFALFLLGTSVLAQRPSDPSLLIPETAPLLDYVGRAGCGDAAGRDHDGRDGERRLRRQRPPVRSHPRRHGVFRVRSERHASSARSATGCSPDRTACASTAKATCGPPMSADTLS